MLIFFFNTDLEGCRATICASPFTSWLSGNVSFIFSKNYRFCFKVLLWNENPILDSWFVSSNFIFILFFHFFLIIYLIKTHKYLILKIIRKRFYEAKHVDHESHVWFLFLFFILDMSYCIFFSLSLSLYFFWVDFTYLIITSYGVINVVEDRKMFNWIVKTRR